jgi:two-component system response regulator AlgR
MAAPARHAEAAPAPAEATAVRALPALVVADRGRVLRVPLDEVLYLRAGAKLVTLRTAGRQHLLDESLAELEQRLASLQALVDPPGVPPRFLRVHRNALVAVQAVRALERREGVGEGGAGEGDSEAASGWAVRVAPLDEWLAVSRRQVAAVRAALQAPAA